MWGVFFFGRLQPRLSVNFTFFRTQASLENFVSLTHEDNGTKAKTNQHGKEHDNSTSNNSTNTGNNHKPAAASNAR